MVLYGKITSSSILRYISAIAFHFSFYLSFIKVVAHLNIIFIESSEYNQNVTELALFMNS